MRILLEIILFFLLFYHHISAQESTGYLTPPYTCTTATTRCEQGDVPTGKSSIPSNPAQGRPGKSGAPGAKGAKGEKGDPCHCNVADEEVVNELREMLQVKEERYKRLNRRMDKIQELIPQTPATCQEYDTFNRILGKVTSNNEALVKLYPLKHQGIMKPLPTNCSSNWSVVQRRKDGSVDFYRGWESYVNGFGDPEGEFWIGLTTLHELTSSGNYILRIEMVDRERVKKYAEYRTFEVGNEESKFKLTIGGYSGTAGDSMARQNGMKFTTFDGDNDIYSGNCAERFSGAWWYESCYHSNLNGKYLPGRVENNKGVVWYKLYDSYYSLKFVEMKIRPE